jgi:hypothetical protein
MPCCVNTERRARHEGDRRPPEWCSHHEVLWCALKDEDGEILDSLGGIIDPHSGPGHYWRVVQAELASDAMHAWERTPAATWEAIAEMEGAE